MPKNRMRDSINYVRCIVMPDKGKPALRVDLPDYLLAFLQPGVRDVMHNYPAEFFNINNIFIIYFPEVAELAAAGRVECGFVNDNIVAVNYSQHFRVEFKQVFVVIVKR